jgi:uncharacterized phiE125 gp8 family phage protein
MRPPVLVTPPSGPLVSLSGLKAHCLIEHSQDDEYLVQLERAAVAHLDGWNGALGRCVLPQTWRQDFDAYGRLRLQFPDVTEAAVSYFDGTEYQAEGVTAELDQDYIGPFVIASGPETTRVRVEYTCGLPMRDREAVAMIVKLLVGHWHQNRTAVSAGQMVSVPMSAEMLIGTLRRVNV